MSRSESQARRQQSLRWSRAWTVARIDLNQLVKSKDFWIPMGIMAGLFFVVLPAGLLLALTHVSEGSAVQNITTVLGALPDHVREGVRGSTAGTRASYAFAVYLFAPVSVIVPLTVSSAVGSQGVVGERERGTGEFLANAPVSEREMYVGKLIAALLPGYVTLIAGFGAYSLIVNLIVGPKIGSWFFPTAQWWHMILWVMPPFIAVALGLILRVSGIVRSAAAAQQASSLVSLPLIAVAYGVASGSLFPSTRSVWIVGGIAWAWAIYGLYRGAKAMQRERLLGVDGRRARKRAAGAETPAPDALAA